MKLKERISWLMGTVQRSLFPHLDECLETPLTKQEKRLVTILEIVQVEKHVYKRASNQWLGRKNLEREALARSFVAKDLYRHPTTRDLIRALESTENLRTICGFMTLGDVPSESTFSRAFAEFATSDLGNRVHGTLVKEYLAGELIGHISRDSTAITGREKPAKKIKEAKKPAKKRGRPAKDEHREPVAEKRLDRQVTQSAEEAISELPTACDRGTKMNAKGYKTSWNGFKLHLDITDVGLPISALVTSASLHDSQVAIPLIKLTSGKVTYFYDLMDAAYDAARIDEASRQCNHVPIIDKNGRGKEVIPMAPHEAERYKGRSVAERANSRLKEDFGANNVMVRGATKVTMHLMFGVITLFADQLIRLLS
jgi:transposase